jgi:hypothetical protein
MSDKLKEVFLAQNKIKEFKKSVPEDLYMKSRFLFLRRAMIRSKFLGQAVAF